jgi:ClpP class serine protease
MTALNPIYGFIGRSSNAAAMALSPTYTGLPGVVQAALALGNEDPTASHIAAYTEGLARKYAGLPTDEQWIYYDENLYARSENGIAFIPVWGMLFNKCGWACSYFTGYDYLHDAYAAALADPAVVAVVFDVDSFGGEVQGCMELTDWMYEQRSTKPTLALANANACSAGYAILSSAERASGIESSYVGSVGVVLVHVDYSGYMEKNGIKVSLLYEGAHKVDGNPYQPLPEPVRKEWQADLVRTRERFAGAVARNRSMSTDAVLATEARVYGGHEGLGIGFIDAVESPMAAVIAFSNELSGSSTQEYAMTTQAKPGALATTESTTAAATETPIAVTPAAAAPAAAAAAPVAAAPGAVVAAMTNASDERVRIKGIQGCDEAKGREGLAAHLAFETSMSADQAKALLAASPKATGEDKADNPFAAAMQNGNPNVGADGEARIEGALTDRSAALLRDYGSASGRSFK